MNGEQKNHCVPQMQAHYAFEMPIFHLFYSIFFPSVRSQLCCSLYTSLYCYHLRFHAVQSLYVPLAIRMQNSQPHARTHTQCLPFGTVQLSKRKKSSTSTYKEWITIKILLTVIPFVFCIFKIEQHKIWIYVYIFPSVWILSLNFFCSFFYIYSYVYLWLVIHIYVPISCYCQMITLPFYRAYSTKPKWAEPDWGALKFLWELKFFSGEVMSQQVNLYSKIQ